MNTITIKRKRIVESRDSMHEFSKFFKEFVHEVNGFDIYEKHVDQLYNKLADFTKQYTKVIYNQWASKHIYQTIPEILQESEALIIETINAVNTKFKRNKLCENNILFVKPVEKAIGLKWICKIDAKIDVPFHGQKEATYQYVPIINTLKSLFAQSSFKELYLAHNKNKKCVPGVFESFCCGRICQNSIFFLNDPLALQLQLFIDDFEVCCAMKSKKKIHKLTAMYSKILNLPTEHSSKLDNIYLVSLCETDNFKQSYTSLDYILENIVAEFNQLADIGIEFSGGETYIKGTLANLSFDNLGGNGICGFTESFVHDHFCRSCEKNKVECRTLTREDPTSLRNIANYEQCISEILQNENGDRIVMGIKKY